jgi:membrane protein YdbS with pleckstrin-like domain
MPLLRPHTRTRLVELLDRPLGFYITGILVVWLATAAAQEPPYFAVAWPRWLVWILTAASILGAISAGIVGIWLLRSGFWLFCRQLHRLRTRGRPSDLRSGG